MRKGLVSKLVLLGTAGAMVLNPIYSAAGELKVGDEMPEPRGKMIAGIECKDGRRAEIYDAGDNDPRTLDMAGYLENVLVVALRSDKERVTWYLSLFGGRIDAILSTPPLEDSPISPIDASYLYDNCGISSA
ncbi:MAG: hypothetical protein AABX28_02655 [Nanoarchaeota archaeon]